MDNRLLRLDFWASVLTLVWFFLPGKYFAWGKSAGHVGEEIYLSGFELMMNFGMGGLVFSVVPLSCAYIIICAFFGDNDFLPYAQKGVLLGVGLFVVMSLINTVMPGFYVALASGIFLWWASGRRSNP
jgi:hypothetical protein